MSGPGKMFLEPVWCDSGLPALLLFQQCLNPIKDGDHHLHYTEGVSVNAFYFENKIFVVYHRVNKLTDNKILDNVQLKPICS